MIPRPPGSILFPYTTLFRSRLHAGRPRDRHREQRFDAVFVGTAMNRPAQAIAPRSEEHTSELQSRENLVCRLLLEKKKKQVKACTAVRMDIQLEQSSSTAA